ncbi:hypothetical protein ACEQPO_05765 [Bacillus sp. SL00103]
MRPLFSWNPLKSRFEQNEQKHLLPEKELKFIIFTSIQASDIMTERVEMGYQHLMKAYTT